MRTLQRLVFFVLLLLSGALALWVWDYFSRADSVANVAAGEGYTRSISYGFAGQEWLDIPFPNTSELKIITTAVLKSAEEVEEDGNWGYVMEYQLLDRGNTVLKEWQYHYRTGISKYRDQESGTLKWRTTLADLPGIATYSRTTIVPVGYYRAARKLRVRVAQLHPELSAMLVRTYVKEKIDEKKSALLWKRFDSEKREKLARVSVLGAEFLRKEEIENLLTYRWIPKGPAGVEGNDYQVHILLSEEGDLGNLGEEEKLPQGIYVDPYRRGILPLPEESLSIDIETIPLATGGDGLTAGVDVYWQGDNQQRHWFIAPRQESAVLYELGEITGGILEFVSRGAVVIRAYAKETAGHRLLQSEPVRVKSYLLSENRILDYAVEHVGSSVTPFRIDLRAIADYADQESSRNVQYQLINQQGAVVGKGEIPFTQPFSSYDYVSPEESIFVSEVERRYFELAADVSRIRLGSSSPVLISAYSRPHDLKRLVRVPEDYSDLQQDPLRIPSWFGVRPLEYSSLVNEGYSMDLIVNSRPAQMDNDIAEGNYVLTEYEPQEIIVKKEIFVPRLLTSIIPERSRAGIYSPLPGGRASSVRFVAQKGRQSVFPRLLFLAEKDGPHDVEIVVDGKSLVRTRLFSSRGSIQLPLLAVGSHDFLIKADEGIAWWINYSGTGRGTMLVKSVHGLTKTPLHYLYRKEGTGEEVLTGTLYCENDTRNTVSVSLAKPVTAVNVPGKAMTFSDRVFSIQSRGPKMIPVLDDPGQWLNMGQRFYIPIGEDLPGGDYTVRLEYEGADECYLTMSHIFSGLPTIRQYYREGDLRTLETEQ